MIYSINNENVEDLIVLMKRLFRLQKYSIWVGSYNLEQETSESLDKEGVML